MSIAALSTSLSLISLAIFTAIILSVLIWLLIRKRRNRVWLPTLRLIKLESSPLPKLRFVRPPMILFLCFLLCCLAMFFLSLKPSEVRYRDASTKDNRTHIFIDLSPSLGVYARSVWEDYVTTIHNYYQDSGSVTISSSSSAEIMKFVNSDELLAYLKSLEIHRYGFKLGKVLHQQLENEGTIDRLVIISDDEKSTWSDFNWQALQSKIEVLYAKLPELKNSKNTFIDRIIRTENPTESVLTWNVSISRNFQDIPDSGILELKTNKEIIRTQRWEMAVGEQGMNLTISVPRKELLSKGVAFDQEALLWEIKPKATDVLPSDNLFRSFVRAQQQDVLIVANPQGEMFLDDPAHHLKTSLEVLGFRTHRIDKISDEKKYLNMPLWVIIGGDTRVDNYCPNLYGKTGIQNMSQGDRLTGKVALPAIWLLPAKLDASWESLCHCYSNLTEDKSGRGEKPLYCEELETRDQYVSVLSSVGAQQVGGSVSDIMGSWAWHRKRLERGIDVLAFTVPLRPLKQIGLSYDMVPTMVRSFLQLNGLISGKGQVSNGAWPRVDEGYLEAIDHIKDSNIPRPESLLLKMPSNNMPPIWDKNSLFDKQKKTGVKEEDDPRAWIQLCFGIVVGVLLIEFLWIVFSHLMKGNPLRKELLLLFGLLLLPDYGEAKIDLNLIGYDYRPEWGGALARDVGGRTSIEMSEMLVIEDRIDESSLGAAWLWLRNPKYLYDKNGKLRPDIENWIKRGGFLVVEGINDESDVKNLVVSGSQGGWKAIPPDHEIMRSFHLLDSLPKCLEHVWLGYHFDDRLAIVGAPMSLLDAILKRSESHGGCQSELDRERATRIFVNILMVALATDYKKDQIHLPEILKRLR